MSDQNIALIYYSRTNNTEKAAEFLKTKIEKKKINIDMIKIIAESKPNFFKASRSAMKQDELPIKNTEFDLSEYDTVVLGVPSWANHPAPYFKSFLNNVNEINKKKYAIFITCGRAIKNNEQTIENMKNELANLGANNIIAELIIKMRKGTIIDGEKNIGDFIDELDT